MRVEGALRKQAPEKIRKLESDKKDISDHSRAYDPGDKNISAES